MSVADESDQQRTEAGERQAGRQALVMASKIDFYVRCVVCSRSPYRSLARPFIPATTQQQQPNYEPKYMPLAPTIKASSTAPSPPIKYGELGGTEWMGD